MPGRDQTGPLGAGPASGRSMGACGQAAGRGLGRRGVGFCGRRNRFWVGNVADWSDPASAQNPGAINTQIGWLKNRLDVIQKRLEELASQK